MRKFNLSITLFSIAYWMVAALYFIGIRYSYTPDFEGIDKNPDILVQSLIPGVILGLIFGFIESNRKTRMQSFLMLIIFRALFYDLLFTLTVFVSSLYNNSLEFAINFLFQGDAIVVIGHLFVASMIYHFLIQINRRFGPGILFKYVTGAYFKPKEEERIFMFLDLKSSTTLAEKFGNIKYSQFIQNCFNLLTDPIQKSKGEIYQFVGDEVVLTWKLTADNVKNCLDFYFDFDKTLANNEDFFVKEFGVRPYFKAGVSCGTVTVAEVGSLKTEIAYHGDVLNTAARIQGLCNEFDKQLLISEFAANHLNNGYKPILVTETTLRGKEEQVGVFTVNKY